MKITKNKLYAVLTGDIIGSSRLTAAQRKKLLNILRKTSENLGKAFPGIVPCPIDIFRGDSWQLIITDPLKAVRAAIFFRAAFRSAWGSGKHDTRLAVGIGAIDFIPSGRISEGDGEAFRLSGSALENMKKSVRMSISISDDNTMRTINTVLSLVDVIAGRWTDKQALAVTGALRGFTQEKIAMMWKPRIKQQTVNRHLERAGWNGIEQGLNLIEYSLLRL